MRASSSTLLGATVSTLMAGEPAAHALFALTLLFAFYILGRA